MSHASLRAALIGAALTLAATLPAAAEDKTGEKNNPRVAEICDLIAQNADAVGMGWHGARRSPLVLIWPLRGGLHCSGVMK